MNSINSVIFSVLRACVLAGGLFSAFAYAVTDVLDTPSEPSNIIPQTLLLDIEKVGDRLVAVGARGHIIYSDDKGRTWVQAQVPVSVLITAVDFADDKNGWAVGHHGLVMNTNDGGKTWTKQLDGHQANELIVENFQQRVDELSDQVAALEEEDEEQYEFMNDYVLDPATFIFEELESDAANGPTKPMLGVHFSDSLNGIVVGASGYAFKTDDGGQTWSCFTSEVADLIREHLIYNGLKEDEDLTEEDISTDRLLHFNAIGEIAGGTLFLAGEGGLLLKSDDQGESWQRIDSPYHGSFFGVTGTGENDVALVFGLKGNVFRSEDAGESWDTIESNTEATMMAGAFDGFGNVTLVGNSGGVIYSSDGGRTFSEKIREDRLGNVGVTFIAKREMIVVGEAGVLMTDAKGLDIK